MPTRVVFFFVGKAISFCLLGRCKTNLNLVFCMRKLMLTLLMLACLQVAQAQNHTQKYKSVNFYGNGVTEHIHIVKVGQCWNDVEIYYFTSKNPTKIQLNIRQYTIDCIQFSECTSTFRVNFPNDQAVYKLTMGIMYLSSQDASGKLQEYEYVQE